MRKVLLCMVAVALAASASAGEFNKVLSAGDKAPDFAGLQAVAPNGEQTSVTLSDVKDDVVVVVFLSNLCPVVKAVEDRLNELNAEYKDKGVRFIGVCTNIQRGNTLADVKKRLDDPGDGKINYLYAHDDDGQTMGKAYGAVVTPSCFVLDKDRKIAYLGAVDDNQMKEDKVSKHFLKDAIDAVLAGKTPEVTETRATGCGIPYGK